MGYKMGSQSRTPWKVIKKNLGQGILGEANNDGTIFIDKSIRSCCS